MRAGKTVPRVRGGRGETVSPDPGRACRTFDIGCIVNDSGKDSRASSVFVAEEHAKFDERARRPTVREVELFG